MPMCEFCELYQFEKEEAKLVKEKLGMNTYFKAKLYVYHVKDRIKSGTMTHKGMKLAYCPTCGRKLSEV